MMLSLRDVTASIARTTILNGVSLDVAGGQTAGLVGRNGAGKTTLMRAIMGLLAISRGEIRLDDHELTRMPPHQRAGIAVGYMPEDRRLVPNFTVKENILLPLWATGRGPDQNRLDWVFELMPEIAGSAERKAVTLSGGQQKLVALGRALICGKRLLLLDEPFEGVAPALARRLAEVIADLQSEGVTVVLSESDYTHSVGLLNRLFVIERGVVEERDLTVA
ncbi:ATP-binding cassette domain-containing protein [Ectothiorhodospiraceae bacterium WFHF3C12]|nr:ATP-binding cassette domain-containing protein [Ectothiorhodospiraceae bacterium WFHF3C12]